MENHDPHLAFAGIRSRQEVNDAIQTHFDPEALHTAMAGSVPERTEKRAR